MLKRGKHVCRRICAKSVRLDLEPYSRYLISRGYSARTSSGLCPGRGVFRAVVGDVNGLVGPRLNNSLIEACRPANVWG